MEIKQKLNKNLSEQNYMRRDDNSCSFLAKNLFEKEDKVKF